MWLILKTIVFFIFITGISFFAGYLYKRIFHIKSTGYINDVLIGLSIILAIFELECAAGIYLKISLHTLLLLYGISLGILCLVSIIIKIKTDGFVRLKYEKPIKDIHSSPFFLIFLVLFFICLQTFMSAYCMRQNTDDSSYVAIANTAIETNTLLEFSQYTGKIRTNMWEIFKRAFSPFQLFVAVISKYFNIHPAILFHVILPIIVIPTGYIVYWQLGKIFFKQNVDRWYLLLFLCWTNIFGAYSTYSVSVHFLTRGWQGKAIYAAVFIPWLIYRLICINKENNKYNWVILFLSSIAGILFTNVAIIENILLIMAYMLIETWKTKRWYYFINGCICCIPSLIFGGLMLVSIFMSGTYKIG